MTSTAAPTPPLLRLPAELLLRVSSHLNTVDLGKLRLTCKHVETYLFESFAREFFTKRQFMTEQISLDALVGIANHKTLAPYLKEVIISLDIFPIDFRESTHFRAHYVDREVLLATGEMLQMLVEASSKLPNLRTVGLRDYDANGRIREGETARWRSFGWFLLHVDDSDDPEHDFFGPLVSVEADQIYAMVHYALVKAAARPQSIEVFLRRRRLSDLAFSYIRRPGVNGVLLGLKTLLLSLDERTSRCNRYEYLARLLCQTPQLEHLRLNFKERPHCAYDDFLAWLGSPKNANMTPMPPAVELPCLTTLEMGMLTIHPAMFVKIISKFEALRSLSLWKVVLAVSTKQLLSGEPFPWSVFLLKLAKAFKQPPNVESIMIGWPALAVHRKWISPAKFASKVHLLANGEKELEGSDPVVSFRKRVGYDAQHWLTELAEKAYLPVGVSNPDNGDSESESDMSESNNGIIHYDVFSDTDEDDD